MSTVLNDAVRVERDGALVIVTIDHPPANAISRAVINGITQAITEAEADAGCRALVLTGAGPKFFAAGADISEFGSEGADTIATGQQLTLAMERSRLPIIAFMAGKFMDDEEMQGMSFGHAGTIVEGKEDSATEKIARLEAAGIPVVQRIDEIPDLVKAKLAERSAA